MIPSDIEELIAQDVKEIANELKETMQNARDHAIYGQVTDPDPNNGCAMAVSYTHLTLPTIA